MSLDAQKLDSTQRQQIMMTVQQQMAIQNAQELLQVTVHQRSSSLQSSYLFTIAEII